MTTTTTTTTTTTIWSAALGRNANAITVHHGIAPVVAVFQMDEELFADYGDGLYGPVSADFYADACLQGVEEAEKI